MSELAPLTQDEKNRYGDILKNVYYVALSGMQKSIRRGYCDQAVNLCKVAWLIEPFKLFSRLWTVCFEDCGRDLRTLRTFYDWRGNSKDFMTLLPLIKAMAVNTHSQDAHWLRQLLKQVEGSVMSAAGMLKGISHDPILFTAVKEVGLTGMSAYDNVATLKLPEDKSWIVDICDRSLTFDWEKFALAVPFFFLDSEYEESVPVEGGDIPLWENIMPLATLDGHTRPGKRVLSLMKHQLAGASKEFLDEYDLMMFLYEGASYKNFCTHSRPLVDRALATWGKRPGITDLREQFEASLDKLNEVRLNVIHNDETFTVLKRLYYTGPIFKRGS